MVHVMTKLMVTVVSVIQDMRVMIVMKVSYVNNICVVNTGFLLLNVDGEQTCVFVTLFSSSSFGIFLLYLLRSPSESVVTAIY